MIGRIIGGIFIVIAVLFFIATGYSIWERNTYENRMPKKTYTIELHYLNGEVETKNYILPDGIHLQVNCHSHKGNFNGCNLEYVYTRLKFGSHWISLVEGVNFYKLKSIK